MCWRGGGTRRRTGEGRVLARGGFKAAALASASASSNGEVTREFACTPRSKAGLCPWPQITGTDCAGALKEMISRVLDSQAGNPLSRAFARVRKKGNVRCRSLGTRRALALLRVPSLHLAFDHQMTPPSPGPLFRASRSRGPLLRLGCRAPLRGPSDLKNHAVPDCGASYCALGNTPPASPSSFGQTPAD